RVRRLTVRVPPRGAGVFCIVISRGQAFVSDLILANDRERRNRTVLPGWKSRNRQDPELRTRSPRVAPALLLAMLLSLQGAAAGALAADVLSADAVVVRLQERLARVRMGQGLSLDGLPVAAGEILVRFYADRDHRPVWTGPRQAEELFALLGTAESHGLDPDDYYLEPLRRLHADYLR